MRNLAKLGIDAQFRTTDFALYQKRMDDFDFDMTTLRYPDSSSPGNDMVGRFGSQAAFTPGSDNAAGIASPAIDALLAALLRAQSREQLLAASRARDRVLMHGYYVVPDWLSTTHRVAYRSTLRYPATLPLYYAAEPWILSTWWDTRAAHGAAAASQPAAGQ